MKHLLGAASCPTGLPSCNFQKQGRIPQFLLSAPPSTQTAQMCRTTRARTNEPCTARPFKRAQKLTCNLTRKLMGTWGMRHFANHDFVIELQTQPLILTHVLSPEQEFVGSSRDPILLFPFPNFTFLIHESRTVQRQLFSRAWLKLVSKLKPLALAGSQPLCISFWA